MKNFVSLMVGYTFSKLLRCEYPVRKEIPADGFLIPRHPEKPKGRILPKIQKDTPRFLPSNRVSRRDQISVVHYKWEEDERTRRSLERRLKDARIGRFKPLADFDSRSQQWPVRCDRGAVEGLMSLEFIAEAANVVLVGPNGVGKSTLKKMWRITR